MRCTTIRLTIITAIVVLGASGALAQQQEPNPDFVSALNSIEAGEYESARTSLQEVVKAEPENEAAWYYWGVAEYMMENLAEALKAFVQAEKLTPKRPGIRLYIGRIYEAQGALPEAVGAYQQEIPRATGSQRAEVLLALGRVYSRMGQLDKAVEVLEHAAELENNYVEALYHLGLVQTAQEQYPQAIKTFKDANKILEEWNDFQVRLQRLSIEEQRRQKQTEENMAQQYARAEHFAEQSGLWPALNKALGETYSRAREWAEARNAYRAAADTRELGNKADPGVYTLVARAYLADAQEVFRNQGLLFTCITILKAAEKSIETALEYDAEYAPAHEARGEIYAFQAATYSSDPKRDIVSHTYEDAIEELTRALVKDRSSQRAMLHLGRAYIDQAERVPAGEVEALSILQQANSVLQQAVGLNPTSAELYAELARVELGLENWEAGLQTAQYALTLDPQNLVALNTAGLACYYQNRLGEAANYFTKAIEAVPQEPQSYTNLGNTFFQMQSWYRARREYKRSMERISTASAVNIAYQRSYILYLMGLTYHETEMYDAEIEALNDALALDSTYTLAYRQLARAYLAKKEYRAARRALQIALQQAATDEQQADINVQIGEVYEAENDTHSAIGTYSLALKLDANNPAAAEAIRRLSQQ